MRKNFGLKFLFLGLYIDKMLLGCIYYVTMLHLKHEIATEEQEIGLLREWLPKVGGDSRAYIKGAAQALLYAQEEPHETTATAKNEKLDNHR